MATSGGTHCHIIIIIIIITDYVILLAWMGWNFVCELMWIVFGGLRNPVNALIIDVTMVGNEEEVNLTDVTLVSDDNFLN